MNRKITTLVSMCLFTIGMMGSVQMTGSAEERCPGGAKTNWGWCVDKNLQQATSCSRSIARGRPCRTTYNCALYGDTFQSYRPCYPHGDPWDDTQELPNLTAKQLAKKNGWRIIKAKNRPTGGANWPKEGDGRYWLTPKEEAELLKLKTSSDTTQYRIQQGRNGITLIEIDMTTFLPPPERDCGDAGCGIWMP